MLLKNTTEEKLQSQIYIQAQTYQMDQTILEQERAPENQPIDAICKCNFRSVKGRADPLLRMKQRSKSGTMVHFFWISLNREVFCFPNFVVKSSIYRINWNL